MNTRRCYKIADRLNAGLQRELGQGIDRDLLVHQALYARDVLLVCDAMRGSELAQLARAFRAAQLAPEPETTPAPQGEQPAPAGGFSPSRFLSSLFGPSSSLDSRPAADAPPAKRSGWFGRADNADSAPK